MKKLDIFKLSFFGGLVFVLEAILVIRSGSWVNGYLIGMGQMMLGFGLIGIVITEKNKEVSGNGTINSNEEGLHKKRRDKGKSLNL